MASGPYTDGTLDERSPPSFFLDWVYTFALSASVAVSSNIEGFFKIVNTHVNTFHRVKKTILLAK